MDVHPPKNGIFIGIDPYPYDSFSSTYWLLNAGNPLSTKHMDIIHESERTHLELNEGGPISERKKHLGEGSEVIWCTLARKKSNPRCYTDLDESADESADERAP